MLCVVSFAHRKVRLATGFFACVGLYFVPDEFILGESYWQNASAPLVVTPELGTFAKTSDVLDIKGLIKSSGLHSDRTLKNWKGTVR